MSVKVVSDMHILQEATQILMNHFSPAKMARLWALWQIGSGDYLAWRDEVFSEKTVVQLYEEIEAYTTKSKTEE